MSGIFLPLSHFALCSFILSSLAVSLPSHRPCSRLGSIFAWHSSFADTENRYALAADIQTIPGLPTAPGYLNVDLDVETGEIYGLF
jgi:hypothetical protein